MWATVVIFAVFVVGVMLYATISHHLLGDCKFCRINFPEDQDENWPWY